MPVRVLIVAGNRLLREALTRVLKKRSDMDVLRAVPFSAKTLEELAVSLPRVLILDAVAIDLSDLQFVHEAIRKVPGLKVVMVGMEEDKNTFLRTVWAGAVGYVLKDASDMDVVAAVRAVANGEAAWPARLCLSLSDYVSRNRRLSLKLRPRTQTRLTPREQQLVPLIAQGLTNKEIAAHLNISEQTVKNHVHNVLQKAGVTDRLSAVDSLSVKGLTN